MRLWVEAWGGVWELAVIWSGPAHWFPGAHADLSDLGCGPGHLASFGLSGDEEPGTMLEAA
jgi:hypothetical protein